MNYKFGIKAAVLLDKGLSILGATALVILLTGLFGQHTFCTGTACVIPGILIEGALTRYILREGEKYSRDYAKQLLATVEDEMRGEEPCRFNDGGQCTYSEEPMACVREKEHNGNGGATMDVKEKLVELLKNSFAEQYEKRGLLTAPHTATDLIANGVMVNEPLTHCQRWIPVTERLPVFGKNEDGVVCTSGKTVLRVESEKTVHLGYAIVVEDEDGTDLIRWYNDAGACIENVSHWMPLPEPPEVE